MAARVALIILLILIALFAGISIYYGSPDPCRMLAKEVAWDEARERERLTGIKWTGLDEFMERWIRAQASQMSTGECTTELFSEWGENFQDLFSGD